MQPVIIIGGGPAGLNTAYHLARKGFDVNVFEEHSAIGLPFQCTGIVTSEIENFVSANPKFLINKIHKAEIIVGSQAVSFNLSNPNLILDRPKFDQFMADRAEKAGAKIHLSCKYLSNTALDCLIKCLSTKKTRTISFSSLIGADGPNSPVARHNQMVANRDFWVGIQARAYLPNENVVKFFPTLGTYAWIVPENKDIVRIGVVGAKGSSSSIFRQFIHSQNIKKVIDYQGGIIPKFNPKQLLQVGNIYLVGDAASQVKATTGGGIVQGLIASQCLANSIASSTSYKTACRKLHRDLWLHLQMRNFMDCFSQEDWKKLLSFFKKERLRAVLENHEREYPLSFLFRAFLSEPRLMGFGLRQMPYFLKRSFYK